MNTGRELTWTACLIALLLGCGAGPETGAGGASDELRRVHVEDVVLDARGTAMVLLQETGGELRRLPIWIGPEQARSIFIGLEEIEQLRPNTHDLVLRLLGGAERAVTRVVVTELRDATYYAVIELEGAQPLRIDARPSDAIAIAVRAGVPILVTESVLSERRPGIEDGESLDVRLEQLPQDLLRETEREDETVSYGAVDA